MIGVLELQSIVLALAKLLGGKRETAFFEFYDQDLAYTGDLAVAVEAVSRINPNRPIWKGNDIRSACREGICRSSQDIGGLLLPSTDWM